MDIKGPFVILTLSLWQSSVDIYEISLFPNFQMILRLRLWVMHFLLLHRPLCWKYNVDIENRQFDQLFCQKMNWQESAHKHMYLKLRWCKNLNFLEHYKGMRLWITEWTFKLNLLFSFQVHDVGHFLPHSHGSYDVLPLLIHSCPVSVRANIISCPVYIPSYSKMHLLPAEVQ